MVLADLVVEPDFFPRFFLFWEDSPRKRGLADIYGSSDGSYGGIPGNNGGKTDVWAGASRTSGSKGRQAALTSPLRYLPAYPRVPAVWGFGQDYKWATEEVMAVGSRTSLRGPQYKVSVSAYAPHRTNVACISRREAQCQYCVSAYALPTRGTVLAYHPATPMCPFTAAAKGRVWLFRAESAR
eukprot:1364568-Rhodomonas_salina.1